MKTHCLLTGNFLICALIGLSAIATSCGDQQKKDAREDRFSVLETSFADPPPAYRSMPLWVWNGKVTEAELERMLVELKAAGFGGLFVHPRPGLITEYLSDEWFERYAYTVKRGKELGLEVWIYDENSYPSGFAGGHVPQEMPESYNQGQGLVCDKVELLPDEMEKYVVCLKKEEGAWKDITPTVGQYKKIKGEYYLYRKTFYGRSDWYGGYSYVDLLLPGVTEKFIEVTMKGYEQSLKNEFGKTIPGIFTDEPNIVSSGGLRWTPDLFDVFQQKWGYDLKPLLPLLGEEAGEWKKVRHNYMETLLQLFVDRWSKPWNAYCVANNLQWTGHYWEHGWPQMNDGPDNMAMYAWHQVPAIDMLFNQFNETSPQAQFGNVRSVKELRSAANQMGYSRTLSETYGGGGWDETFKDFKRLGDWEYVLGVNFMNQHLSHMTLTGARKYDYPPVFTYHSPWWDNYRSLNDYFGRLSLVMSKGVQQNDILVIEPNSTLWGYYSHTGSPAALMEIGKTFQAFVTLLEKSQVEYDLGSENIIKDQGKVKNGRFIVGQASYSTVIIPPACETLNTPTFDLLRRFAEQGGQVIAFTTPTIKDGVPQQELSAPTMLDGAPHQELAAFFSGKSPVTLLYYPATHQELTASFTGKAVAKETEILIDDLRERLLPKQDISLHFENGNLYHHRRRFADGELILLVNSSLEEASTGTLSVKGKTLLEMDAMDGRIYALPSTAEKGILTAPFRIEPAGSLLLFSSYKTNSKYEPKPEKPSGETVVPATAETTVRRMKANALPIDFCDVTVGGQTHKGVHFSPAADIVYKAHGFANGNPWNTSVQYKRNIVDRDTFQTGGFTAVYSFTVNEAFDYSSIQLVAERPGLFTVKVNGETVTPTPDQWFLDRSFGVYAIGGQVRKGVNTVELSVSPMSIFAELEPVYLLGDFSVVPEQKGWSVSAPVEHLTLGSWKEQKQPFYSWSVSYSKPYNITGLKGTYSVQLGKWNGTVAEVHVNGTKAGIIAYAPWQLDVTPYLKEGANQIDIQVIGSLKNLLGPHYGNPSPGLASPWHWKSVKEPIPASQYQLIDYGLIDDFSLIH
ncbi:MAG: hypothetical protein LBQ78_00935 [Tannerellaceae bacterium]|jgi:hypothetical protein|nr:hypothetical protein [Tannerellaceae bacterium]